MSRLRVGRPLALLLLALAGLVALGHALGQPILLGYVTTGSMTGTLDPGQGFVAVPAQLAGPVHVGDVVTYRAQVLHHGHLTTHRVVDTRAGGFVTRGDANLVTDQQAGEPVVRRSQVVAKALRVNGRVVAIPFVGAVVGAARGVLAVLHRGVAGVVGPQAISPTRIAVALFAVFAAAFALDDLLGDGRDGRERAPSRDTGLDAGRALAVCVAVVVVAATAAMLLASGPMTFAYDSVSPNAAASPGGPTGGVPAGGTRDAEVTFSNGGFVPVVVLLDAPNGAPLSRDAVVLGPRSRTSVTVTVSAPATPGRYEQTVVRHRYLAVLPVSALRVLDGVGYWAGVAAVDSLLAAVLGGVGLLLFGRGRLRSRGPPRPLSLAVRRAIRLLYR